MPVERDVPVDRALLDPAGVFPQRLAEDRAALASHSESMWRLDPPAREERLRRIATLAHRLGGAAGTFGYHAVSDAALALEDEILAQQSGASAASGRAASEQPAVQRAIDALALALHESLTGRQGPACG